MATALDAKFLYHKVDAFLALNEWLIMDMVRAAHAHPRSRSAFDALAETLIGMIVNYVVYNAIPLASTMSDETYMKVRAQAQRTELAYHIALQEQCTRLLTDRLQSLEPTGTQPDLCLFRNEIAHDMARKLVAVPRA